MKIPDLEDEFKHLELLDQSTFDENAYTKKKFMSLNEKQLNQIDLIAPLKKIHFKINECEELSDKIVMQSYAYLMDNVLNFEEFCKKYEIGLNPSLNNLNKVFSCLKNKIINPYENISRLLVFFQNLHKTIDILNIVSDYLFFFLKLKEIENSYNTKNINNVKKTDYLLTVAKIYIQLFEFKKKMFQKRENELNIISLDFIQSLDEIYESKKKKLINDCVEFFSKITIDFEKEIQDESFLECYFVILFLLNKTIFFQKFENLIKSFVNFYTSQMLKKYKLSDNVNCYIKNNEIKGSFYFEKLKNILLKNNYLKNFFNVDENFLELIYKHFNAQSLLQIYLYELSSNLDTLKVKF